jgi:hypothetical protein
MRPRSFSLSLSLSLLSLSLSLSLSSAARRPEDAASPPPPLQPAKTKQINKLLFFVWDTKMVDETRRNRRAQCHATALDRGSHAQAPPPPAKRKTPQENPTEKTARNGQPKGSSGTRRGATRRRCALLRSLFAAKATPKHPSRRQHKKLKNTRENFFEVLWRCGAPEERTGPKARPQQRGTAGRDAALPRQAQNSNQTARPEK